MARHLTAEANRKRRKCPFTRGSHYQATVVLSWDRGQRLEVPRICLEHLGLNYLIWVPSPPPYWISPEETAIIRNHEHTIRYEGPPA